MVLVLENHALLSNSTGLSTSNQRWVYSPFYSVTHLYIILALCFHGYRFDPTSRFVTFALSLQLQATKTYCCLDFFFLNELWLSVEHRTQGKMP